MDRPALISSWARCAFARGIVLAVERSSDSGIGPVVSGKRLRGRRWGTSCAPSGERRRVALKETLTRRPPKDDARISIATTQLPPSPD
jgi:hypothetical protein